MHEDIFNTLKGKEEKKKQESVIGLLQNSLWWLHVKQPNI